jgi:hypothetical protein
LLLTLILFPAVAGWRGAPGWLPLTFIPRNNKQANIMPMAKTGVFGAKKGFF